MLPERAKAAPSRPVDLEKSVETVKVDVTIRLMPSIWSARTGQNFSRKSFEWNILTYNSFRWNILRGNIFSPLLFPIFCRHTVGGGCNQLVNRSSQNGKRGER